MPESMTPAELALYRAEYEAWAESEEAADPRAAVERLWNARLRELIGLYRTATRRAA